MEAVKMIEKLKEQMAQIETDYAKFQSGNKSAGTRTRKHLQELKKLCQQMRLDIMGKKDATKIDTPTDTSKNISTDTKIEEEIIEK